MTAVIIDKSGNKKEVNIKEDSLEYLSKKCSFKNEKNFQERTIWNVKVKDNKYTIKLFAKDDGRANNENKYDFPPPVDTKLYFGSCILVNYDDDTISSLNVDEWEKIYEKLFGGFENLDDKAKEDEFEEDELDDIDDEFKTKEGYLKDGFVVDDNSESLEDDEFDSELSEELYVYSDEEK